MEVHVVHRDVCGGPTDDHGVAAGFAAYLLVVRLRGCTVGRYGFAAADCPGYPAAVRLSGCMTC